MNSTIKSPPGSFPYIVLIASVICAPLTELQAEAEQLHAAILGKDLAKVSGLIKQGADVNSPDKSNNDATPLVLAAYAGDESIVELLLKNGANVSLADNRGITPLHMAAQSGSATIAEILINKGADLNAQRSDEQNWTPLHYAAFMDRSGVVSLLASSGCDLNIETNDNATALIIALLKNHGDTAAELVKAGATGLVKIRGTVKAGEIVQGIKLFGDQGGTLTGATSVMTVDEASEAHFALYLVESPDKRCRMTLREAVIADLVNKEWLAPNTIAKYDVSIQNDTQVKVDCVEWNDVCLIYSLEPAQESQGP